MNISKPTLLINKKKAINNITMMKEKAERLNVTFRPHFKTHQSIAVGKWFADLGVDKITVSSLSMAIKFEYKGFEDITIAFPINVLELNEINNLNTRAELNVIADNKESVRQMNKMIKRPIGLYIEIDAGYHRSGIPCNEIHEIQEVICENETENHNITFKGFISHFGDTYTARSTEEIEKIYDRSIAELNALKTYFSKYYPDIEISIGDTPSCSIVKDFNGADEIRPGNFIYYDIMQYYIGSCTFDQIAVAVACPVVSKRPERNEVIIYGGSTQLSKEFTKDENENIIYGLPSRLKGKKWGKPLKDCYVSSLSQEHGTVKMSKSEFDKTKIGELLAIVPVHSCLVADLLSENDIFV